MRELKFRVWDEKYNCWDTSHNLYFYANSPLISQGRILQQYTGMKDKNGKEIYEGDIVQYNQQSSYDGMNFIIKWSDYSNGWILQSKTGEVLTNEWTPNGNRFTLIQIVGNIFENKELLK